MTEPIAISAALFKKDCTMSFRFGERNIAMLGIVIVTLGVAASTPSLAAALMRSPAPSYERQALFLAEVFGDENAAAGNLHARRCTNAYPMHHMNQCGTATGGPSGGLH